MTFSISMPRSGPRNSYALPPSPLAGEGARRADEGAGSRRALGAADSTPASPPVIPGLDPGIQRTFPDPHRRWVAGSGPAMTGGGVCDPIDGALFARAPSSGAFRATFSREGRREMRLRRGPTRRGATEPSQGVAA